MTIAEHRRHEAIQELAVMLGALGVKDMHVSIAPAHIRPYRVTLEAKIRVVGDGHTLTEAIDDASMRLKHRIAHDDLGGDPGTDTTL